MSLSWYNNALTCTAEERTGPGEALLTNQGRKERHKDAKVLRSRDEATLSEVARTQPTDRNHRGLPFSSEFH